MGGEKGKVEAMKEKVTDGTGEWNLEHGWRRIALYGRWVTFLLRKEEMKRINISICRDHIFEGGVGDSGSLLFVFLPVYIGVVFSCLPTASALSIPPAILNFLCLITEKQMIGLILG